MSIYIFKLMVSFYPHGVDNAQAHRAKLLDGYGDNLKFIFTEFPRIRELDYYNALGIKYENMLSMHMSFTDHKLSEYHLEEGEISTDVYTDGLYCREYYNDIRYVVRRRFYNTDGSWVYDEIHDTDKIYYSFADGRLLSKEAMIELFIKRLELSSSDCVIVDRPDDMDFSEPLYKHKNGARLIGFLHSIHYDDADRAISERGWFYEYYNWIRNIEKFDALVVSTEQQKKELMMQIAGVSEYIPKIVDIPAGGLKEIKESKVPRRPFSLVSSSRLEKKKKIEWIIMATILAQKINPEITLDIYGNGSYEAEYRKLVADHGADGYIRFMGYNDRVADVMNNYEVFITASLGESLGLSMMEAVAAGNAVIAFDVRYGSRMFIKDGENGILVPYDKTDEDENETVKRLAKAILKVFSDRAAMEKYEFVSYTIAENYLDEPIKKKWLSLLEQD